MESVLVIKAEQFMQFIDYRLIYFSAHNMGHARLSTQVSIQKQLKYQAKIKMEPNYHQRFSNLASGVFRNFF